MRLQFWDAAHWCAHLRYASLSRIWGLTEGILSYAKALPTDLKLCHTFEMPSRCAWHKSLSHAFPLFGCGHMAFRSCGGAASGPRAVCTGMPSTLCCAGTQATNSLHHHRAPPKGEKQNTQTSPVVGRPLSGEKTTFAEAKLPMLACVAVSPL